MRTCLVCKHTFKDTHQGHDGVTTKDGWGWFCSPKCYFGGVDEVPEKFKTWLKEGCSACRGTDECVTQPVKPLHHTLLWLHLVSAHAMLPAPDTVMDELLELHQHEHEGPGTVRDHDREDISHDLKKVSEVLGETND